MALTMSQGAFDREALAEFRRAAGAKRGRAPPSYFRELLHVSERWLLDGDIDSMNQLRQIRKDLPRSFENLLPADQRLSGSAANEEWMQRLEHVLAAQTVRSGSRTFYTQGMNFLAAMCLVLVCEEESAFWLYCKVLEDALDADFFAVRPVALVGYHSMQALVKKFARQPHHCPKLCTALGDDFDQVVEMLLVHWLFSAFVNCLPWRLLQVLWKWMLLLPAESGAQGVLPERARGTTALVAFALAALRHCGEDHLPPGLSTDEVFKSVLSSVRTLPEEEDVAFLGLAGRVASDLNPAALALELATVKQRLADPLLGSGPGEACGGQLQELAQATHFSRSELAALHAEFQKSCSEKGCTLETFRVVVGRTVAAFPTQLCEELFRRLDRFRSGRLSFVELMVGMSVLTRGGVDEKLRMTFGMFDSQNLNRLSLSDVVQLCAVLHHLTINRHETQHKSPVSAPGARQWQRRRSNSAGNAEALELGKQLTKSQSGPPAMLRRCPSEESFQQLQAACQPHEVPLAKGTREEIKAELLRGRSTRTAKRRTIATSLPFLEESRQSLRQAWTLAGAEPESRALLLKLLLVAETQAGGSRHVTFEGFRHALLTEPRILLLFSWCLPEPPDLLPSDYSTPSVMFEVSSTAMATATTGMRAGVCANLCRTCTSVGCQVL